MAYRRERSNGSVDQQAHAVIAPLELVHRLELGTVLCLYRKSGKYERLTFCIEPLTRQLLWRRNADKTEGSGECTPHHPPPAPITLGGHFGDLQHRHFEMKHVAVQSRPLVR
uniref:Uncharacterized protein n=1 Tax=Eptatretus burgeri TaxID=7764 RepID=A0A8C4N7E1_EPTBU